MSTSDNQPAGSTRSDSSAAHRMPAVGDMLGKYRIEGELGAGGMGTVFRAHDSVLGREVALKVMRFHPEDGAAAAKRFLSEDFGAVGITDPMNQAALAYLSSAGQE